MLAQLPQVISLILLLGVPLLSGCQPTSQSASQASLQTDAELYPVTILEPPQPTGVQVPDPQNGDETVTLSCQACHSVRTANRTISKGSELKQFHQGLHMSHGKLKCVSCHNEADDYSNLHLADGSSLEFSESMQLCAQCHGSQHRDYLHGAHGGMTGYWDLSRGGRTRNHCLHCHDAHAPAYPMIQPVAAPRDRFSPVTHPSKTHENHHESK